MRVVEGRWKEREVRFVRVRVLVPLIRVGSKFGRKTCEGGGYLKNGGIHLCSSLILLHWKREK